MSPYIAVFIGGGIGSLCRYGVSQLQLEYVGDFPIYTFIANVLASFILGVLVALFLFKFTEQDTLKLLLATGFCGGFSTFSTFSLETFNLLQKGAIFWAIGNVLVSVVACVLAVALGWYLVKMM